MAPADGCACRKPAPELIRQAAAELGVDPADCVMIGDIGADAEAAYAAGARAILVPTPHTRPEETAGRAGRARSGRRGGGRAGRPMATMLAEICSPILSLTEVSRHLPASDIDPGQAR